MPLGILQWVTPPSERSCRPGSQQGFSIRAWVCSLYFDGSQMGIEERFAGSSCTMAKRGWGGRGPFPNRASLALGCFPSSPLLGAGERKNPDGKLIVAGHQACVLGPSRRGHSPTHHDICSPGQWLLSLPFGRALSLPRDPDPRTELCSRCRARPVWPLGRDLGPVN